MKLNILTMLAWIFGSALALGLSAGFFSKASGDSPWDWPQAMAAGCAVGIIVAGEAYGVGYMVTDEAGMGHVETNGVISDVELDGSAFDVRLEPDGSEWPEEAVLVSEEGEFMFSSDIRPGVRSVELHPDGMGVLREVGT
jgi:hypothetical protein